MEDLSGQSLGPYKLLNRVGMGGMASVYRAYQPSMDRYVAVKVLPREFAQDPAFVGRFEQEAKTIARLEHRHILPVYDYGEHEGITYLVMRYIDAGTLKDLIARGPVEARTALRLAAQVADALDYGHRQGVTHRDVKPSNVLIDQGGDAYLTDFGIAKLAESVVQFTGSGQLIGTPSYMSPEQGQGKPTDPRSDIYSLGIVLYEMVTGRLPFEAETPVAVVLMHLRDPLPPPRAQNPALPEDVERIILKATAKAPEERYPSAAEMSRALQDALSAATTIKAPVVPPRAEGAAAALPTQAEPPPTVPLRAPSRRLNAPLVAGAVIAAAVLVGALLVLTRPGGLSDQDATATAAQATQVAAQMAQTHEAATLTALPTITPEPSATPTETPPPTPVPFPFVVPTAWDHFTSSEEVYDLVYHDGAVWAATGGGLVRWSPDGAYTKYTTADGLPFTNLRTLIFDRDGALWLGRNDSDGLARVSFDADKTVASVDDFSYLDDTLHYVWDFLQTDDALLLSEYGPTFRTWNGETWEVLATPPEGLGEYPYTMAPVDDKLWVGTDKGLVEWDGEVWSQVELPEVEPDEPVYMVYIQSDGGIWVTTARRSLRYAPETQSWSVVGREEDGNLVTAVMETGDGNIWVGEPGYVAGGPLHGDQGWQSWNDLPGWDRRAIVEDGASNIWVATNDGVLRYDGTRWKQFTLPGEPPTHYLAQILPGPDGRLWFPVAYYNSFVTYDPATDAWSTGFEVDLPIRSAVFSGETLWAGTEEGLIRLKGGVQRRYTVEDGMVGNIVNTLVVDPQNADVLWIGTNAGISRFDSAAGMWENSTGEEAALPDDTVTLLYTAPDGRIWAASGQQDYESDERAALSVFDGEAWTRVGEMGAPFEPNAHRLYAMITDAAGNLWVSTGYGGLHRWDGARWRTFYEADGAPTYTVVAMLNAPDGSLWFSADEHGLYRFHADEGWSHLSPEALGWRGTAHAIYLSPGGDLWLLTDEGIIRFKP